MLLCGTGVLRTFRLCSTRPRSPFSTMNSRPIQTRAGPSAACARRLASRARPGARRTFRHRPRDRGRAGRVPRAAHRWRRAARRHGAGADEVASPNLHVNRGQEQRCFHNLLQCSGVPSIGLSIGARLHVSTLGLAGYAMLISGSVMQAFRCMGQFPLFMGLYFDVRIDAHADGMSVTISRYNGGFRSRGVPGRHVPVEPAADRVRSRRQAGLARAGAARAARRAMRPTTRVTSAARSCSMRATTVSCSRR